MAVQIRLGAFEHHRVQSKRRQHRPPLDMSEAIGQGVRVVKESDSKSDGLCPRGFESPRCRSFIEGSREIRESIISSMRKSSADPNIAQLVERSTVDVAAIEWSLVRFRVFGLLFGLSGIDVCNREQLFSDRRSIIGLVVMTSA